ncbi:hypothetical protein J4429_00700 [Candidatus Pacearchaeota archaeon]|nr:hypothetical protein [Candidatus Pacearchaeota archaeon]
MDRQQLRRDLLAGMCRCAEEISIYHHNGRHLTNISFLDRCPVAFKPRVGDKYLFQLILDEVIDNIVSEQEHIKWTNEYIMGAAIMGRFYYPQYGRFDEQELEEVRRE